MSPEEVELRRQARRAVATALRHGEVVRLPCELCGAPQTDAHHLSYRPALWLLVHWLCPPCHRAEHQRLKQRRALGRLRWIHIKRERGWREQVVEAGRKR